MTSTDLFYYRRWVQNFWGYSNGIARHKYHFKEYDSFFKLFYVEFNDVIKRMIKNNLKIVTTNEYHNEYTGLALFWKEDQDLDALTHGMKYENRFILVWLHEGHPTGRGLVVDGIVFDKDDNISRITQAWLVREFNLTMNGRCFTSV